MRYILNFRTSFPESTEYDYPKGYSICKYLETALLQLGFDVSSLDNYRDMAWSLDCAIGFKKVFFFVGYLGTSVIDWQLIICSSIGFIGWLLRRKDTEECLKLAKAIHSILSNDKRFNDLKWFSRCTNSPKDIGYSTPDDLS